MKHTIIMLNGYTGVGKSSVAKYLASLIPNSVSLHSAVIRRELGLATDQEKAPMYKFKLDDPIFVNEISRKVYGEMVKRGKDHLRCGKNLILDATYNFSTQREEVYKMATEMGIHLLVLNLVCAEDEVITRLERRAKNPDSPFAEVSSWETYLSTKVLGDPIKKDFILNSEKPHIVKFDTSEQKIKHIEFPFCEICENIAFELTKWKRVP